MRKGLVVAAVAGALVSWSAIAPAADYSGKKILYIDSYHEGYAWSDGITAGVQEVIGASGAELKIIRMDTKRNKSDEFKKEAALKAKAVIEQYQPDVVIASDDNASKYLIVPFYKNAELPFVFCGVNWDASPYGFPFDNVTGMVEVTSFGELVELLRGVANGDRIAVLGPDTMSEHREFEHTKRVFDMDYTAAVHVSTFEEWKRAFVDLQGQADILLLPNNSGINDWNDEEAAKFVEANAKIPSGSAHDFMAPFALIAYAKLAEEQGRWSGEAALKILDGTSPKDIPITRNKEGKLFINARIAELLQVELPPDLLDAADTIIE